MWRIIEDNNDLTITFNTTAKIDDIFEHNNRGYFKLSDGTVVEIEQSDFAKILDQIVAKNIDWKKDNFEFTAQVNQDNNRMKI